MLEFANLFGLNLCSAPVRAIGVAMLNLLATCAVAFSGFAFAGRPLAVDDAGVLADGDCQVEVFFQSSSTRRETNLQPACGISSSTELTAAVAQSRNGDAGTDRLAGLQVKTSLREFANGNWGATAAVGASSTVQPQSRSHDLFAAVAVSLPLRESTGLHLNMGAARARGQSGRGTWGIALEQELTARTGLTIETYGESRARTRWQLGARTWRVQDVCQIDLAVGGQHRAGRTVTIGLTLVAEKLFARGL